MMTSGRQSKFHEHIDPGDIPYLKYPDQVYEMSARVATLQEKPLPELPAYEQLVPLQAYYVTVRNKVATRAEDGSIKIWNNQERFIFHFGGTTLWCVQTKGALPPPEFYFGVTLTTRPTKASGHDLLDPIWSVFVPGGYKVRDIWIEYEKGGLYVEIKRKRKPDPDIQAEYAVPRPANLFPTKESKTGNGVYVMALAFNRENPLSRDRERLLLKPLPMPPTSQRQGQQAYIQILPEAVRRLLDPSSSTASQSKQLNHKEQLSGGENLPPSPSLVNAREKSPGHGSQPDMNTRCSDSTPIRPVQNEWANHTDTTSRHENTSQSLTILANSRRESPAPHRYDYPNMNIKYSEIWYKTLPQGRQLAPGSHSFAGGSDRTNIDGITEEHPVGPTQGSSEDVSSSPPPSLEIQADYHEYLRQLYVLERPKKPRSENPPTNHGSSSPKPGEDRKETTRAFATHDAVQHESALTRLITNIGWFGLHECLGRRRNTSRTEVESASSHSHSSFMNTPQFETELARFDSPLSSGNRPPFENPAFPARVKLAATARTARASGLIRQYDRDPFADTYDEISLVRDMYRKGSSLVGQNRGRQAVGGSSTQFAGHGTGLINAWI